MKRYIYILLLMVIGLQAVAQQPLTHIARKGDTLYGIAKQYGVSLDELLLLNPNIKNKPRQGQVIVISLDAPQPVDTVEALPVEPEVVTPVARPVHNIVALLPLMLDSEGETPKGALLMTDFVKGMLLAANDLRQPQADSVTITVYDTFGSASRLQALLDTARVLQAPCVIIPPDDATSIVTIGQSADRRGQKVFNILNAKDESYSTMPSMMQANITHDDMYLKAINYMLSQWPTATLVTLEGADSRNDKLEFVQAAREAFQREGRGVVDIKYQKRLEEQDLAELDPAAQYLFLPTSGSLSEFNRIYGGLRIFKEETSLLPDNVQLMGYPDWSAFRGEALRNLDNLNTSIYTRFYDNNASAVNGEIERQFRQWYGADMIDAVPKQGLLGYDVASFLINGLRQGGIEGFTLSPYEGIQSAFDMQPAANPGAGMSNKALIIIHFSPDGTIERRVI